MPGRHQLQPSRSRLRWLAGVSGGSVVAAILLALAPTSANASSDPVKATFSVTGVSTSNCNVSAGGSDVWVKPGQELDVKSSLVGLTLPTGPLDLSKVASFGGALVIDAGTSHAQKIDISDNWQKSADLAKGDHSFKWTVDSVKIALLTIPLKLTSSAAKAGANLTYTGTIHVSDKAANCGIAVQVPGVQVSASVTHLPPVNVSLPGVKATVPVSVPSLPTKLPSLPGLPHVGGSSSSAPQPGGSTSSAAGNELPVPARVVPHGDGQAIYGNAGGYVSGVLPGSNAGGGTTNLIPAAAKPSTSAAAPVLQQDSTGKHKTIDLAASKADSTGQFSVILAIVAIIALSVVAATYARLYLLRRTN
jgi:hypothetical protein